MIRSTGQTAGDALERFIIAGMFVALAAVLTLIVAWRYAIFRNDVDLGIFTQVIAGIGHGFSTTAEGGVNHLLVHWSPIIAFAWPMLKLFGPVGLEYFQAILVSATLFPIWGMARARFGVIASVIVTALAGIYPLLWANGVGDFHEMAFVPFLSASLVYAIDRRRWTMGALCALALLFTKEDQFVVLGFNSVACIALGRNDASLRRFGICILVAAVAMAAGYFLVVRSVLQPHIPYAALHFFSWPNAGVGPSAWLGLLERRGIYALTVLGPVALLPLISRYGWFLVPGFVEIFASHEPVTLMPGAHYGALLTGYALAAFVDGAGAVARRNPRGFFAVTAAGALVSAWFSIYASPMEYWYYLYRLPNAHDAALTQALRTIPANADVGSEDEIFSHIATDPNASIDMLGQEWFVYDRTHYSDRWRFIDEPAVKQRVRDGSYRVVEDRDGVVILRRASTAN